MCVFPVKWFLHILPWRISQLMTSHTKTAHYWIWITIETALGICFMFLVFVHELNQISIHFNIPASTGWTRGEWMLDAVQEWSRWWPLILVLHLHSGSVGPASLVDFGQFYEIIQYIISYMYIHVLASQASLHLGTSRISSAPYVCLWENRSRWFKNGSWAL